jgi:Holliday junction resolvasome RuvABC endonuclease subunit
MSILALDLGNKFGWAIKQNSTIDSGWEKLSNNAKNHGKKFYLFSCWLREQDNLDINKVYYEDVKRHAGVYAAHAYGGYLAILQVWAYKLEIECVGVGVGQIKKFWTGKGNASKEMMISEANKRGFDTDNDNCADAIALLHYALDLDK